MTTPTKPAELKIGSLIEMPNGAWIAPRTITSVRPLPTQTFDITNNTHRARVCVIHGSGLAEVFLANDDEHARQMAREIAQQVNQAIEAP